MAGFTIYSLKIKKKTDFYENRAQTSELEIIFTERTPSRNSKLNTLKAADSPFCIGCCSGRGGFLASSKLMETLVN